MSVEILSSIHSTAVVGEGARIGAECHVGPYCVIGEHAELGDGCRLHSHVVIEGHTTLGARNRIFPFASIGHMTQDLKWDGGRARLRIGDDNTFREYVSINLATADGEETVVGSQNHILAYCHIAHDCHLGDGIIMSNVATLAGHVVVEDQAVIGGLAAVHQFCRIGRNAIVGGCSKVTKDVAPYMMVDGNPAKTRMTNQKGLDRRGISRESQAGLKQAYKILFRENLSISNGLARIEAEIQTSPEIEHLLRFIRGSHRGIG